MNANTDNAGGLHLFRRLLSHFLTEEEIKKIERASVFLKFKKGETILKQGNKPTHIAFLQSGMVKFNYSETHDRNLIITLVKAPKILGGANLFYKDLNFFSIIALEESEVILVDKDVLLGLLVNNGKLAVGLFQTASEMFKQSILNFVSVASKQKESRIADVIIYLVEEI
jgi:CRP-like cAMP-binding protein